MRSNQILMQTNLQRKDNELNKTVSSKSSDQAKYAYQNMSLMNANQYNPNLNNTNGLNTLNNQFDNGQILFSSYNQGSLSNYSLSYQQNQLNGDNQFNYYNTSIFDQFQSGGCKNLNEFNNSTLNTLSNSTRFGSNFNSSNQLLNSASNQNQQQNHQHFLNYPLSLNTYNQQ